MLDTTSNKSPGVQRAPLIARLQGKVRWTYRHSRKRIKRGTKWLDQRLDVLWQLLPPAFSNGRVRKLAFLFGVASISYWGFIAADLYVSEAHIMIKELGSPTKESFDLGSILSGGSGGRTVDQMMLKDYLLSTDVLEVLDKKLDLRGHYSNWRVEPFSRMLSKHYPMEWFHRYFLTMVTITFDDSSGVLIVQARAFTPQMAQQIVQGLIDQGEIYMNSLAHDLAQEQVVFLEKQVESSKARVLAARQDVIDFQNKNEMVSPEASIESKAQVIETLEGELAKMQVERTTLLGYLANDAPAVIESDLKIAAVRHQIAQEQMKMSGASKDSLNHIVEEYQRLTQAAKFTEEVYETSLAALERGRFEAMRAMKKIVHLQSPTLPEYPLEPRRLREMAIDLTFALVVTVLLGLVSAVVRDHKD